MVPGAAEHGAAVAGAGDPDAEQRPVAGPGGPGVQRVDVLRAGCGDPAHRLGEGAVDAVTHHRHTGVVADRLQHPVDGAQSAGEHRNALQRPGQPGGEPLLVQGPVEEQHDRDREVGEHGVDEAAAEHRPGRDAGSDRSGVAQLRPDAQWIHPGARVACRTEGPDDRTDLPER